ncbi:MAG: peptidylprolyl isomerase [Chloroflexi bacterium]|nr:peptidylprolyl isomerase [Chloroflexota bacterium]
MPRRTRPPFPLNLIFNIRAFYLTFIVMMIASLAAVGLGPGLFGGSSRDTERLKPPPEGTGPPTTTSPTPAVSVKTYDRPKQVIDSDKGYLATIKTAKGDVVVQLFAKDAPTAVNSLAFLAEEGFYEGLTFHIVRPEAGFALAGDPTCDAEGELRCTGGGGPGYVLPLEENGRSHLKGFVAMAAVGGGNTVSGSQFYILLRDDPRLDGRDTVIGRVVEGMAVLGSLTPRNPCFEPPSAENRCKPDPPPGDQILGITVQEA